MKTLTNDPQKGQKSSLAGGSAELWKVHCLGHNFDFDLRECNACNEPDSCVCGDPPVSCGRTSKLIEPALMWLLDRTKGQPHGSP